MVNFIDSSKVVRLGLKDDDYAYVVPLAFGYEVVNNKIILYIHSASEGHKIDLINRNSNIFVEFDNITRFYGITCEYNSVMAHGHVELVEGIEDKTHAYKLMLKHCKLEYNEINKIAECPAIVYKIILSDITAKYHE
nr:pyridoxamine 5'-phosphate oxidase family protein [uncultured Methanosphaera sp.]